jgi:hypothetical protein
MTETRDKIPKTEMAMAVEMKVYFQILVSFTGLCSHFFAITNTSNTYLPGFVIPEEDEVIILLSSSSNIRSRP